MDMTVMASLNGSRYVSRGIQKPTPIVNEGVTVGSRISHLYRVHTLFVRLPDIIPTVLQKTGLG